MGQIFDWGTMGIYNNFQNGNKFYPLQASIWIQGTDTGRARNPFDPSDNWTWIRWKGLLGSKAHTTQEVLQRLTFSVMKEWVNTCKIQGSRQWARWCKRVQRRQHNDADWLLAN